MQNFELTVLPVGDLRMNAVLVTARGRDGRESLLIDPGDEPDKLLGLISAANAPLVAMAATHGHFDHVGATAALQETWNLPLLCHHDDLPLIAMMPTIQQQYGFPPSAVPFCEPILEDGYVLELAGHPIGVRHVPGHSPGQVMFVLPGHAIVGDCLFKGSIGRTDLPGGNPELLEISIRERIYTLPAETVVICGHGPDTTVGKEKTSNPFIRA